REQHFAARIARFDPELRPEVIAAVLKLSPQQRAMVTLTYWEDLSPDQIGELLEISPGTVKSHLARARSRLREVLDE
ncbi:MAG: sigma-70 family RNA polymerase sigma factor, partial [Acidimicrobiia bacterium]